MGSVLAQCGQLPRKQYDPGEKLAICRVLKYVLRRGSDKGTEQNESGMIRARKRGMS